MLKNTLMATAFVAALGLCFTAAASGPLQREEPSRHALTSTLARGLADQAKEISDDVGAHAMARPGDTGLECVQVSNTSWSKCKDSGGVDSACATAQCSPGYMLTGGGGSCSAGDRKIKSLYPKLATREFGITCEDQGVKPNVHAICCKL